MSETLCGSRHGNAPVPVHCAGCRATFPLPSKGALGEILVLTAEGLWCRSCIIKGKDEYMARIAATIAAGQAKSKRALRPPEWTKRTPGKGVRRRRAAKVEPGVELSGDGADEE